MTLEPGDSVWVRATVKAFHGSHIIVDIRDPGTVRVISVAAVYVTEEGGLMVRRDGHGNIITMNHEET